MSPPANNEWRAACQNILLSSSSSKRRPAILFLLAFLLACSSSLSVKKNERYYQKKWCFARGGRIEVRLQDGTRADCVTREFAIEFDFAGKRLHAIGQAINYAEMTGKRAGIVLICRSPSDRDKYLLTRKLLKKIRDKYYIRLWHVGCDTD